jgi:hypothetical protein
MRTRLLVRLYPRAWRARYGEEFAAVLAERRLSPRTVIDVIAGAADAHLHPGGWHHERVAAKPGSRPVMLATSALLVPAFAYWLAVVILHRTVHTWPQSAERFFALPGLRQAWYWGPYLAGAIATFALVRVRVAWEPDGLAGTIRIRVRSAYVLVLGASILIGALTSDFRG